MPSKTIVWFRRDLRLHDNPAWNHAVGKGSAIIPVFIHSPKEECPWQRGEASNWWLHHALEDLASQLEKHGLDLVIRDTKNTLQTLTDIIDESGAEAVCWNRCYEPAMVKRDKEVKKQLQEAGIETHSFNGSLLLDPLKVTNKSGKPYQVFTPFWKHCRDIEVRKPETEKLKSAKSHSVKSLDLTELNLLPNIPWHEGMAEFWTPTRDGAIELLESATSKSKDYDAQRDIPSDDGTSRLSPYLHFGQISPREFFHHIRDNAPSKEKADTGIIRQLYWREFSAHLLFHFPHSQDSALKPEYEQFPWDFNEKLLRAWQKGETGFPIVDAGMRQLWHTGWMHNRVRMIAGSLLVKHLLQPWQEGARWFWDTLVDADLPNNSMGWQWVGGCGADASPYFRIFNPITQGEKFDPDGDYVRKWIPELAELPTEFIHSPWEATPIELKAAGVELGKNYPKPIVTHKEGRQRALDAYEEFKEIKES
ncbi:deoxyribodipyrimidine photo-lyase [Verrucomicrobiaceae bacterium 5K15]|uniref:Deoxyribodipyrimidine photo-lyase n=1 Tax=Oceaniferula flava TaxID=2800421 RepID=A0AAE2SAN7_9BACT|nr:deoxyribodipyrimidine photo-lyase [Oceaniferula flavus]MBK1854626.1 deoxyribodipyrimidine photo-lyase [Oceaniferula flavus]MBM1135932.1 deoxyribodipyrimidine photo-lyase [Oceaniferula flavus]